MAKMAWWWGAGLALAAFAAGAAGGINPQEVRAAAESSMQVTGTVDIAPDGSVRGFALDREEQLPTGVIKLIGSNVPTWRFQPTQGGGDVHATMSLLLIAKELDPDHFRVQIRAASFDDGVVRPGEVPTKKRMPAPAYPREIMGARGTVYLVLRVDRAGKVADAMVEQVNLRVLAPGNVMTRLRDGLSQNALRAAAHWTFNVPDAGIPGLQPYWSIRVPVSYSMPGDRVAKYGEWTAYIPGAKQSIPWSTEEADPAFSPDALVAGGVYVDRPGPRLLTPLEHG